MKLSLYRAVYIAVSFILGISGLQAQDVSYLKTLDAPDETIKMMISVAPLDATITTNKYSSTSAMLSVHGVYGFNSRLGFEASAGIPYFTVGGRKGASYMQGGAFLNLIRKEKTEDTKVILNYKRNVDVLSTTETYKFLSVPAKMQISTGLRAGLHHVSSHLQTDGIKLVQTNSDFTLAGLYAGIQKTTSHLIKTQLAGEKEPTPTGAIYKFFGDVLVYPVSKIDDPYLASEIKNGTLGARAGVIWVQNPYSKKHNTSRYNPVLGRMSLLAELGTRPIDGVYIKGGVFWGLVYR